MPVNREKSNLSMMLLVVAVALASAVAGFSLWTVSSASRPAQMESLIVLPEPREIPEFELLDQDARPFGPERLRGRWSLLFFGFTHCPDICPSTLHDLRLLSDSVAQAGIDAAWQVVFVSVDPERDSPQSLKNYAAYFSPDFIAVTGDHEQMRPLTTKLGIAYFIEEHETGAMSYTVDHSASILLLDPEGRLHGVFTAPHDVQTMTTDFLAVID